MIRSHSQFETHPFSGILPAMHTVVVVHYMHYNWLQILCFAEIGIGLAGFGISFLFLGIILFFDRGLLAIGNVSILRLSFVILSVPLGLNCTNCSHTAMWCKQGSNTSNISDNEKWVINIMYFMIKISFVCNYCYSLFAVLQFKYPLKSEKLSFLDSSVQFVYLGIARQAQFCVDSEAARVVLFIDWFDRFYFIAEQHCSMQVICF